VEEHLVSESSIADHGVYPWEEQGLELGGCCDCFRIRVLMSTHLLCDFEDEEVVIGLLSQENFSQARLLSLQNDDDLAGCVPLEG